MFTQIGAATAAGGVLFVIAQGKTDFDAGAGFATNGHGTRSPDGVLPGAGFVTEVVLTAVFVCIILGVTVRPGPE